jgi:hypothetical protein
MTDPTESETGPSRQRPDAEGATWSERDPGTEGREVVAARPAVAARPDTVDKDTWSGGTVSAETDDVIEARKDRQHTRQMQARVLGGIAGLIVVVLVLVFGSQALHWVSEPFAGRIADLMLPALLASGGTVVGFYFHRVDDHK